MNRESVLEQVLALPNRNILCEMVTGYGKSRIALEVIKTRNIKNLLIVVPRNPLKGNWRDEIRKWWPGCKVEITMSTYVSLPKHTGKWDAAIFDECHHLSERCREALCEFTIKNSILLSATVKGTLKEELSRLFPNLHCYKVSMKDAIDTNVLPDPRVILLPLRLDNTGYNLLYDLNPKSKAPVTEIPYDKKWTAMKDKRGTSHYVLRCTQQQYYNELSGKIDWYKKKSYIGYMKNRWLKECGDRLKWLSAQKEDVVLEIQKVTSSFRSLTFCCSIEQTEKLGHYCINSKNKESAEILDWFNKGLVDHITAVDMLNEGMNLSDCRVGIYAVLNSSETLIKQKLGRILRHKEPVIIIPYYVNTREEEIVERMLEDYNPELVSTVDSVNEIAI